MFASLTGPTAPERGSCSLQFRGCVLQWHKTPVHRALPPDEAIQRIRLLHGFWGPLIDVRIEDGVAVIELPDAAGEHGRHALDKIRQAAKAGRSGRYREAAALYEEALQLLPQHTEARRELAMVQMELGQPAAAKQNLIRVSSSTRVTPGPT